MEQVKIKEAIREKNDNKKIQQMYIATDLGIVPSLSLYSPTQCHMAVNLYMTNFETVKKWAKENRYSLTDLIIADNKMNRLLGNDYYMNDLDEVPRLWEPLGDVSVDYYLNWDVSSYALTMDLICVYCKGNN